MKALAKVSDKKVRTTTQEESIVAKAMETKRAIKSFFEGKITIEELNSRGINFATTV